MKSQKLKALEDFLKRAEIIPEALLFISKNTPMCEKILGEFVNLEYEIPFYELNLSDHPNLAADLSDYCGDDTLPALVYFKGLNIVNKKEVSQSLDLTQFIRSSKSKNILS